ncbi:hypothetical protein FPV24_00510 [Carnobacterium sp. PL24RED07]|uniref:hypothetical protein n=1 Tax=unclassified Carnobacterium TaxID=257487 RepID=UPI0011ED0D71|nr:MULTISPECIES: hypothetical protein [unclassified Carnobacterium]KAF3303622.1 hypothetical protein FPV22_00510 [Carnobacterium sp. PL26RED25]KAF3307140.1 hypothetical protein FPV24_00510 [Carnobacterium sp. PL24RED07]
MTNKRATSTKPKLSESITIFDERYYTEEDYTDGIVTEDILDLTNNIADLIERTLQAQEIELTTETKLLLVGSIATPTGRTFEAITIDYIDFATLERDNCVIRVSIEGNGVINFEYMHASGTDYLSLYVVQDEPIASLDDIAQVTSRNQALKADTILTELYGVD